MPAQTSDGMLHPAGHRPAQALSGGHAVAADQPAARVAIGRL